MKIVMDSDCLVKLTKAGAKEVVVSAIEVHIPVLVKKETVDQVRKRNYRDTAVIEENISKKALHVVKHQGKNPIIVPAAKGEAEVISLYLEGGYDAVASDDKKFLKKLTAANIPYLTPSACLILLFNTGDLRKEKALELLNNMKPLIGKDEYAITRYYLEGKP